MKKLTHSGYYVKPKTTPAQPAARKAKPKKAKPAPVAPQEAQPLES